MVKKVIAYKNFNDEDRVAEIYFHISTAEAIRMEAEIKGGIAEYLKKLIEKEDNAQMLHWLERLIEKGYGFKSEDGEKFLKDREKTREFMNSEVYSVFLEELLIKPNELENFLTALMPKIGSKPPESEPVADPNLTILPPTV